MDITQWTRDELGRLVQSVHSADLNQDLRRPSRPVTHDSNLVRCHMKGPCRVLHSRLLAVLMEEPTRAYGDTRGDARERSNFMDDHDD